MLKVTYLICHYNYNQYLSDAIKSAKNQTYKSRICFIDDFSTDQKDIIKQLSSLLNINDYDVKDNYLIGRNTNGDIAILIQDKTHGPSYARNLGIDTTLELTDIYAVLDADDTNHHTKIEKCIKPFIEDIEHIGVVYADYITVNEQNIETQVFKEPFDMMRLYQECIVHSGALINKSALLTVKDEYGYYDVKMRTCEDYDLWVRISERFMIIHIPEFLSRVRVHSQNSSATVNTDIWQRNWQRIAEKKQSRQTR